MDQSHYWARRLQSECGLSFPATRDELLAICADRGVGVWAVRLRGGGYYLRLPEPLIVLDHEAPASVLAHELYHHLVAELADGNDDPRLAIYVATGPGRSAQEEHARRFAELLCGTGE